MNQESESRLTSECDVFEAEMLTDTGISEAPTWTENIKYGNGESSNGVTETFEQQDKPARPRRTIPRPDYREKPEGEFVATVGDETLVTPKLLNVSDVSRIIVGVDFGTTLTSISFVEVPPNKVAHVHHFRESVCSVTNFPGDMSTHDQRREAPTASWYFSRSDEDLATEKAAFDDLKFPSILWGFQLDAHLRPGDRVIPENQRIVRAKLLLDHSDQTEPVRQTLRPTLDSLKKLNEIRNDDDVLEDFLVHILSHAHQQLQEKFNGFFQSTTEFALGVPALWTPQACNRLRNLFSTAVERSGWHGGCHSKIADPFLVNEPEAAATYAVTMSNSVCKLVRGEAFVVLDCGGGTVDAITYTVDVAEPLRLKREEVIPRGTFAGSSFLNEAARAVLQERLASETYLEQKGITIDGIIDAALERFEMDKRFINIFDEGRPSRQNRVCLHISCLNENSSKKFGTHRLFLDRTDLWNIFHPQLKKIGDLLRQQLDEAVRKGLKVKKVVHLGGFAASPSLRKYLELELEKRTDQIHLVVPQLPGVAVSHGAVFCSMNKYEGPTRICQYSFGFLRHVPWDPVTYPNQQDLDPPKRSRQDNQRWVRNTLHWVLKQGEEIEPFAIREYSSTHTFEATDEAMICREEFYCLEGSAESHYPKSHSVNKGAQMIGEIEWSLAEFPDILRHVAQRKENKRGEGNYVEVKTKLTMTITIEPFGSRHLVSWTTARFRGPLAERGFRRSWFPRAEDKELYHYGQRHEM